MVGQSVSGNELPHKNINSSPGSSIKSEFTRGRTKRVVLALTP